MAHSYDLTTGSVTRHMLHLSAPLMVNVLWAIIKCYSEKNTVRCKPN